MTSSNTPGVPSKEEVRALVSQIVDGVVRGEQGEDGRPGSVESSGPVATEFDVGAAIAVGADHGGYPLKERIAFRLKEAGWEVVDCGTDSHDAVDYPDIAVAVAQKVASGDCRAGIMIDGAGIGSAMVANKIAGVRASLCYDLSSARNAREHNHANVLTLGAGLIGEGLAWQIVEEWLSTEWAGGRHARRVAKIDALDQQYSSQE